MKPGEIEQFATQAPRTIEKADQYRRRAEDTTLDEIDRAGLLAAARAIEINGREWPQVARRDRARYARGVELARLAGRSASGSADSNGSSVSINGSRYAS